MQTLHAADKPLSLVTAAQPPLGSLANYTGILEKISREAFRRIGVDVKVTILPGERALINVNSGIDDGDLFRAPGFESNYPNLVQVPEKIGIMEFMAYSKESHPASISWQDLQNHTIAYATGWKIYDRKVKANEITKVRKINDLFPLLENGRADIVLIDRWQGLYIAKSSGHKVHLIEPPLATVDMYMYLHKNHAKLIPALSQALKEMKRDGSYQKIYTSLNQSLK
ncbi:MAG: transporter substrate-binding domain-containing protein [Gammaproteobacteria bacterium]|nr:transporter substrate-binding domain-containing protein [Gammaproteobacteria bacterium]